MRYLGDHIVNSTRECSKAVARTFFRNTRLSGATLTKARFDGVALGNTRRGGASLENRCFRGAALATALILLVLLMCAPSTLWAEENESEGNRVYVNQLSDSSFLYETSIADLAQADSYYEGQTVLVKGEVVGDRVNDEFREENCWITLQDDEESPSVLAVSLTKDQTSVIDTYGQYGSTGTQLQVRGTFHLECSEHQGLPDVHADEVSALQPGSANPEPINHRVLVGAIIACVIGFALLVMYYVRRERML